MRPLTTILRRKGRALDAMTDQVAGLRRRAAPDDVRLLDALAAEQSQLATLQLSNDTHYHGGREPEVERPGRGWCDYGRRKQARAKGTRTSPQMAAARTRLAHPFYWAAFISSGDWRSMNGKEQ
jgi:CHAT domain-containing protein